MVQESHILKFVCCCDLIKKDLFQFQIYNLCKLLIKVVVIRRISKISLNTERISSSENENSVTYPKVKFHISQNISGASQ